MICLFFYLLLQVSTNAALESHLRTHGGDYQCSYCGGTFNQLSSLRSHERKIHSKTDFFDCGICDEKFRSKALMTEHLKHQHNFPWTRTVTVHYV